MGGYDSPGCVQLVFIRSVLASTVPEFVARTRWGSCLKFLYPLPALSNIRCHKAPTVPMLVRMLDLGLDERVQPGSPCDREGRGPGRVRELGFEVLMSPLPSLKYRICTLKAFQNMPPESQMKGRTDDMHSVDAEQRSGATNLPHNAISVICCRPCTDIMANLERVVGLGPYSLRNGERKESQLRSDALKVSFASPH